MKKAILLSTLLITAACAKTPEPTETSVPKTTFSFIGKITVQDGKRAEFNTLMQEAFTGMDACISCKTLLDVKDPNVIWVSETWPSKAAHDAVVNEPALQEVFAKGRPLIVNMERMAEVVETP